jgi:hypothetical protein
MEIRVRLDEFLAENHLSPYKLACNLRGEVSQTTVYALCRSDQIKRIDLHTLAGVMGALRHLTGREVGLTDLLEEVDKDTPSAKVRAFLTAPPADWESLTQYSDAGEYDDEDEAFWKEYRKTQKRLEQNRRV